MSKIETGKPLKKKRSISLTPKLDDELEELCDYLGVSAHAYLVTEVAKIIQRDRLTFLAKNSISGMMDRFNEITKD